MPEGCASGGCGGKAASGALPPDVEAVRALYAGLAQQHVRDDLEARATTRAVATGRWPAQTQSLVALPPDVARVRDRYDALAWRPERRLCGSGILPPGVAPNNQPGGPGLRGARRPWLGMPSLLAPEPRAAGAFDLLPTPTVTGSPPTNGSGTRLTNPTLLCMGTEPYIPPPEWRPAPLGCEPGCNAMPSWGDCPLLEPDWSPCPKPCEIPPLQMTSAGTPPFTVDQNGIPLLVGTAEDLDDLLAAAWALLQDNLDVIEWLMCEFGEMADNDSDALFECLLDRLLEGSTTFQVTSPYDKVIGASSGFRFKLDPTPGGYFYQSYLAPWQGATTDGDQLCVAMWLAGTLLTEVLHHCGEGHIYDGYADTDPCGDAHGLLAHSCDFTTTLKNSFLYVMTYRYPCTASAPCCAVWTNPDMWAQSGGGCHPCGTVCPP